MKKVLTTLLLVFSLCGVYVTANASETQRRNSAQETSSLSNTFHSLTFQRNRWRRWRNRNSNWNRGRGNNNWSRRHWNRGRTDNTWNRGRRDNNWNRGRRDNDWNRGRRNRGRHGHDN